MGLFPGGFADPNEEIQATALRELEEETDKKGKSMEENKNSIENRNEEDKAENPISNMPETISSSSEEDPLAWMEGLGLEDEDDLCFCFTEEELRRQRENAMYRELDKCRPHYKESHTPDFDFLQNEDIEEMGKYDMGARRYGIRYRGLTFDD